MKQIPKAELSPDNGCIIDMKWKLGSLGYHPSAAGKEGGAVSKEIVRLPELVLYDHIGFKGAYARTNLSFHYIGDFWNDRISCLIVVSGVWRFYRDEYYKGPYWDLGPGYYESFFAAKGPDDVVSSFQCIALTRDGHLAIDDLQWLQDRVNIGEKGPDGHLYTKYFPGNIFSVALVYKLAARPNDQPYVWAAPIAPSAIGARWALRVNAIWGA